MSACIVLRISDRLLQAYADGELPSAQRRSLEQALLDRPELAARVAAYGDETVALQRLYGRLIELPLSHELGRLGHRLAAQVHRRQGIRRPMRRHRAAGMVALVGLLAIGLGLSIPDTYPIRSGAIATASPARPADTVNHRGISLTASSAGPRTIVPGAGIPGPDLSSFGFEFIGAEPAYGGNAIQFSYRDRAGNVIGLYISGQESSLPGRLAFTRDGPASVLVWRDRAVLYGLVGNVGPDQLRAISRWVSRGTADAAPPPGATNDAVADKAGREET